MMRQFLLISFLCGALVTTNVVAETPQASCTLVKFGKDGKNFILSGSDKPDTGKIYIFKNITSQSLWLDHPEHASATAGWSSYLRMKNSSALLLNRKNFKLSCAVITPGKVDYLDCEKVVSVCQFNPTNAAVKRKGTFWLAEDKSWDELLKALEKRGIK